MILTLALLHGDVLEFVWRCEVWHSWLGWHRLTRGLLLDVLFWLTEVTSNMITWNLVQFRSPRVPVWVSVIPALIMVVWVRGEGEGVTWYPSQWTARLWTIRWITSCNLLIHPQLNTRLFTPACLAPLYVDLVHSVPWPRTFHLVSMVRVKWTECIKIAWALSSEAAFKEVCVADWQ